MIWNTWIIDKRDKIADLIESLDSADAITDCQMTFKEREYIRKRLQLILDFTYRRLSKPYKTGERRRKRRSK